MSHGLIYQSSNLRCSAANVWIVVSQTSCNWIGTQPDGQRRATSPTRRCAGDSRRTTLASSSADSTLCLMADGLLVHATDVRLDVFDMSGRQVGTVFAGSLAAGRHALPWNLRDKRG